MLRGAVCIFLLRGGTRAEEGHPRAGRARAARAARLARA